MIDMPVTLVRKGGLIIWVAEAHIHDAAVKRQAVIVVTAKARDCPHTRTLAAGTRPGPGGRWVGGPPPVGVMFLGYIQPGLVT
jgi:hypothetical protein